MRKSLTRKWIACILAILLLFGGMVPVSAAEEEIAADESSQVLQAADAADPISDTTSEAEEGENAVSSPEYTADADVTEVEETVSSAEESDEGETDGNVLPAEVSEEEDASAQEVSGEDAASVSVEDADEISTEQICVEDAGEDDLATDEMQEEEGSSGVCINPLYADVVSEEDLLPLQEEDDEVSLASVSYETSLDTLAGTLRNKMVNRANSIQLFYQTTGSVTGDTVSELITEAMTHTGNGREGDSLLWGYAGYFFNISSTRSGSTRYYEISLAITYYTTASQENALTEKVDQVLAQLEAKSAWKEGTYSRVKLIYQYICSHVSYDTSMASDLVYTPYAAMVKGKAVCQGYALLFYRMCLEEGIDCRLVYSTDHGWNLVDIDGLYYYADTTWDAGVSNWKFFLQGYVTWEKENASHKPTANCRERLGSYYTKRQKNAYSHTHQWKLSSSADGQLTYTCTICGQVNTYTAGAISLETAEITVLDSDLVYNGSKQRPDLKVQMDGQTLKMGSDYIAVYTSNLNAGTGKVTVYGINIYGGTAMATFTIAPKEISTCSVSPKTATYTGKAVSTSAVVKDAQTVLAAGTSYQTACYSNVNVGKGKIRIYGQGNYTGYITKSFTIRPKASTLYKPTARSKGFRAVWKKISKQVTGYQLQYSLKKNFSSGVKTVTMKGTATHSKTIKGLKAKKIYYVRVRTYSIVSGKKYYSAWSTVRAVKTKA